MAVGQSNGILVRWLRSLEQQSRTLSAEFVALMKMLSLAQKRTAAVVRARNRMLHLLVTIAAEFLELTSLAESSSE